jgi:hypothetical protein
MDYHIVDFRLGETVSLAVFESYSEADDAYDSFCEEYPNAWLEIISHAELYPSESIPS